MRIAVALLLVTVLISPSFAAISAKGGLAGGAFRLAASLDRQIKDNMSIVGDLGYGVGSQYNVMAAGASAVMKVRNNIYAGLSANYSSYSETVQLSVGGNITARSGLGLGAFVGTNLRDNLFAQVGYDTRLGLIAETGYVLRK